MSITNVTPPGGAGRGRATAGRPVPAVAKQRRLLIVAVAAVLGFLLLKSFFGGENKYEKIANELTAALQTNDLAAVQKLQNAETATHVNHGVVGRASDKLAPLGKIKKVKETTPKDAAERVHEFDVSFDKGAVHEMMKLDPQDKIVTFRYETSPAAK
ncbi:MAG: hypothetical protein NVSMB5_11140 [Candidatus Velthaea sp.]